MPNTMTDNLPPLLPCPFCGGEPALIARPDNIDGTEFICSVACYCGGYSASAHKMERRQTPEQAKADTTAAWNRRAALAQAQSCVPAERIEELEILAARWTHLEYMYGRGIAPATMAHYIGRPERLDYSAQLHREHGAIAASPQPQPVQPITNYLEEIYAYLCSTSPKGYADEAFRKVPDSLLPDSVRNRLAEQGPSLGADAGAIPEHAGSPEGSDGRDGESVAATVAQPVQPSEPIVVITGYQLREALDFLAPDGTAEQLEQSVCIQHGPERICDAGTPDEYTDPAGLYCWLSDYPEEGAIPLTGDAAVAQSTPEQAAQHKNDPLHDDIQSVLFEVEQAIENGSCPWQIESAFEAYEAARRLQIPAHGIAAPQPKD